MGLGIPPGPDVIGFLARAISFSEKYFIMLMGVRAKIFEVVLLTKSTAGALRPQECA
jgi:hypothetical protein